jgi:hypothetical protein
MTKKELSLLGIIILLIFIPLISSQEISISNLSLKENYSIGEIISGNFNLRAINISPSYILSTNKGHSILLRDFLYNNSKHLLCEPSNCLPSFNGEGTGADSIGPEKDKPYGVKIQHPVKIGGIEDLKLFLELTSDEQNSIPLKIKFLEKENVSWTYQEPTENYSRFQYNGSFDPMDNHHIKVLSLNVKTCQEVKSLPQTLKAKIGLNLTKEGVDAPRLVLSLSKKGTDDYTRQCEIIVSSQENNNCLINYSSPLPLGDYNICVEKVSGSADIKVINQGDYNSLYVHLPTYMAQDKREIEFLLSKEDSILKNNINKYLLETYNNNCTLGCFIPLSFDGNYKLLNLTNLSVRYSAQENKFENKKIYILNKIDSRSNFEGYLNLEKTGFRINFLGNEEIRFYLGDKNFKKEIFSRRFNVSSISLAINSLTPLMVPAGIPNLFVVDVLSTAPISSYQWIFGDGTMSLTNENHIVKIYPNISEYNLTLRVTNNVSQYVEKGFLITTINPKDYLNYSLNLSQIKINNLNRKIDNLTVSFKESIKKSLKLLEIQTSLNYIDAERRSATTESQFLELALRIKDLNIPDDVWIESKSNEPFIINPSDINLNTISFFTNKTITDNKYKEYISNWQIANIVGNIEKIKLNLLDSEGSKIDFATIYTIKVNSKERANLVLQDVGEIESSAILQRGNDNSKFLNLEINNEKTLSFISFNGLDSKIYVTPEIDSIDLIGGISPCNQNGICEKDLLENSQNCRSDCKPVGRAIWIFLLIILITIVSYLFVQIQFKKKYELYLFKSEQELKNLVESIQNSQENKVSEKEITEKLIKNGWSKEQVIYSLKKSRGERTRPYEIISLDKLLTKFHQNKETNNKNELPKKIKK